ncbi:hypothetical protein SAMN04488691_103229 [Haloferax larsenii]|uniref:Uncharacterized protein n=1 Tax=Haloferax larsenii TaxID=302484 RepID=A0A1H7NAP4_HALLR|nr:hypothetical protein SAMN04488691_103229 [Haloferax larsenii]
MSDTYRCTMCRTENTYSYAEHEKAAGLHKHKTNRIPCRSCGTETVQNKLGA